MDDTTQPRCPIRFRPVDRSQSLDVCLDDLLPADHPARLVVAFVGQLDFSALDAGYRARQQHPGAPPFDPRVLFSLWLFATIEGVASARRLEVLCTRDLAFRWICGGPGPNYHTLSTFYANHGNFLDATFIDILAELRSRDLVTVKTIAVDGRKVTANASKESFHRQPTLERHRVAAQEHVAQLRDLREQSAGASGRQAAAQRRAAKERAERVADALTAVCQRQAERTASGRSKPEEARASTTDADARKMKRADGGFQPSFNVQTATAVDSGVIVAVEVLEQASDNGQLLPMVAQVEANTQTRPQAVLADAGYSDADDVDQLEQQGTKVFMPPKNAKKELDQGKDPYQPKRRDKPTVATWRLRMGTEGAKLLYKSRAPVAEGVHAQQSNRGWKRFRLRGLVKGGIEALWHALAHNFCVLLAKGWLRAEIIRPQPI
jgi:transposase